VIVIIRKVLCIKCAAFCHLLELLFDWTAVCYPAMVSHCKGYTIVKGIVM